VQEGELGKGGSAGSVFASAGNGGPWGKGGDVIGTVELPGENGGYGSNGDGSRFAVKPNAFFKNGGNGGDSNHPKRTGGDGGAIDIKGPEGSAAILQDAIEVSTMATAARASTVAQARHEPKAPTEGTLSNGKILPHRAQGEIFLDKHSFWAVTAGMGRRKLGTAELRGGGSSGKNGDWGGVGKCPVQTASVIQDGPQPSWFPCPKIGKAPGCLATTAKTSLLVQSAPPCSSQTMLVLQQPPETHESGLPSDGLLRQFGPSNGASGYHPLDPAQVEEEIRSIPDRFDPRVFRNF
jgi:hypothetical protein